MVALARRQPLRETYRAVDLWNFSQGHVLHNAIQGALAALPGDVFRGWWEAPDAAQAEDRLAAITGLARVPATHLNAKQRAHGVVVVSGLDLAPVPRPADGWNYCEMLLLDDARKLRGHMDGELWWADQDREAAEFKSTATFQADRYNPQRGGAPNENHVLQAHGYMLLRDLDRARIAYLVKASGSLDMVMMEHVVHRDEAIIGGIEALLRDCASALEVGPQDPLPDPLVACDKKSKKRASKCPAKARCFECRAA
jgi:hypothetical protein